MRGMITLVSVWQPRGKYDPRESDPAKGDGGALDRLGRGR